MIVICNGEKTSIDNRDTVVITLYVSDIVTCSNGKRNILMEWSYNINTTCVAKDWRCQVFTTIPDSKINGRADVTLLQCY